MLENFKDIFFKPVGLIDYELYKKFRISYFPMAFVASSVGMATFNIPFILTAIVINFINDYLSKEEAMYRIKDISEMDDLYKEFLCNYHKLNQIFDLNNPLELMILFNYLVESGHLSKNKEFSREDKYSEALFLSKYQVFSGSSVCRHDSLTFRDILKMENIESAILYGTAKLTFNDSRVLDISPFLEEQMGGVSDERVLEEEINKFFDLLEKRIKEEAFDSSELSREKNNFSPNHMITIAKKDNICYSLDACNNRVFRKRIIGGREVLYDGLLMFESRISYLFRLYYDACFEKRSRVKRILTSDDISFDEERKTRDKMYEIILRNQDIFEKFYSQNEELYEEISDCLVRFRKKTSNILF